MCTLTFVPKESGYYFAMNRDERIARGVGTPPEKVDLAGVKAVYPRDTEGGTWIAGNDRGIAFALLNWNDVATSARKLQSRGVVIPALLASRSHREAQATFGRLDLKGILPFRLIGIFPAEKQAGEWRWDQTSLSYHPHSWGNFDITKFVRRNSQVKRYVVYDQGIWRRVFSIAVNYRDNVCRC